MKFDAKTLYISLVVAVLIVITDSLLDRMFFEDIQVPIGILGGMPANELFKRLLLFVSIIIVGVVVSHLRFRGDEAEKMVGMDAFFLDQLLSSIPVPIFYKDRNYIYLGCNESFEHFLGKSRDEIIGKTVFDIAPENLAKVYHRKDVELMDNPGVQVYESKVKQINGDESSVIFHKATFFDIEGELNGMIGVILDITDLRRAEEDKEVTIAELKHALAKVKMLSGFLPICASCKKIRDDTGYWQRLEYYIREHSEADFSHSICPECSKKLFDEYEHKGKRE